jgi:hypothetical protein
MLSVFNASPANLAAVSQGGEQEQFEAQDFHGGMGLMAALGLQAADRRLMWESMNEALALAELEPPECLRRADRLDKFIETEARRFPPRIFSGLLLPALCRSVTKGAALEARRRALLAAIAIERHRLTHQGALPANLEQLVPEFLKSVPADPFDGQALRYKLLPKGYVVYSVGPNRKDDGGKERSYQRAAKDYDETFTVAR